MSERLSIEFSARVYDDNGGRIISGLQDALAGRCEFVTADRDDAPSPEPQVGMEVLAWLVKAKRPGVSVLYWCFDNDPPGLEGANLVAAEWGVRPQPLVLKSAADAEIARLRGLLEEARAGLRVAHNELIECAEYFDNRADADGDSEGFYPNLEMRHSQSVGEALMRTITTLAKIGDAS